MSTDKPIAVESNHRQMTIADIQHAIDENVLLKKVCKTCDRSDREFYPNRRQCKECYISRVTFKFKENYTQDKDLIKCIKCCNSRLACVFAIDAKKQLFKKTCNICLYPNNDWQKKIKSIYKKEGLDGYDSYMRLRKWFTDNVSPLLQHYDKDKLQTHIANVHFGYTNEVIGERYNSLVSWYNNVISSLSSSDIDKLNNIIMSNF